MCGYRYGKQQRTTAPALGRQGADVGRWDADRKAGAARGRAIWSISDRQDPTNQAHRDRFSTASNLLDGRAARLTTFSIAIDVRPNISPIIPADCSLCYIHVKHG